MIFKSLSPVLPTQLKYFFYQLALIFQLISFELKYSFLEGFVRMNICYLEEITESLAHSRGLINVCWMKCLFNGITLKHVNLA